MAVDDKILHILGEIGALIIVNPFMIYLINKYSFETYDLMMIILTITLTFIIDGYLLWSWF